MSVRVVARIRPLLKAESEANIIVRAGARAAGSEHPTAVTIPNPKNIAENFTFNFNSVYERETTQQELFDNEGMCALARIAETPRIRGLTAAKCHLPSNIFSMASTLRFLRTASQELEKHIQCAVVNYWQTEA